METQYFKDYSPALGREMECKVYGHAGRPMLFIPCQDGRFFDFEDFHMPVRWHRGSNPGRSWSSPSTPSIRRPGPTPTATPTGGSAAMSSGSATSWRKLCPRSSISLRSATAGMTCPASSPLAAARRDPCGQPLPPPARHLLRLSGPQRHLHRKIRLWRLHGRGGLPELPCGLYGQLPHRSPLYGPLPQQEGGSLRGQGAWEQPDTTRQLKQILSRKASLSGWTCGAMMSSTTGIGGISRPYIICLIF